MFTPIFAYTLGIATSPHPVAMTNQQMHYELSFFARPLYTWAEIKGCVLIYSIILLKQMHQHCLTYIVRNQSHAFEITVSNTSIYDTWCEDCLKGLQLVYIHTHVTCVRLCMTNCVWNNGCRLLISF